MGRITEVFPGPDGKVRAADVRTKRGVVRRAIHNLALLPIEPQPQEKTNENVEEPPTHASSSQANALGATAPLDHQQFTESETAMSSGLQSPTTSNPFPSLIVSIPLSRLQTTTITKKGNHETSTDMPSNIHAKRRRLSLGSLLVTTLFTCLVASTSCSPMIEAYNKPGIYFENIGTANMLSSDWNLIVYYNLTSFWNAWDSIKGSTNALQRVCQKSNGKFACNNIVSLLQQWHQEIDSESALITKSSRQKRGAFDLIGNAANSLFGLLDSKYEEEISKRLNEFSNNESQMSALLQNHTSIIDATLNIMKQTQERSQAKFTELDGKVQEILSLENSINTQIQVNTIFHSFATLALEILTLTHNFQSQQQAIVDTITDERHGKINPLLISTT